MVTPTTVATTTAGLTFPRSHRQPPPAGIRRGGVAGVRRPPGRQGRTGRPDPAGAPEAAKGLEPDGTVTDEGARPGTSSSCTRTGAWSWTTAMYEPGHPTAEARRRVGGQRSSNQRKFSPRRRRCAPETWRRCQAFGAGQGVTSFPSAGNRRQQPGSAAARSSGCLQRPGAQQRCSTEALHPVGNRGAATACCPSSTLVPPGLRPMSQSSGPRPSTEQHGRLLHRAVPSSRRTCCSWWLPGPEQPPGARKASRCRAVPVPRSLVGRDDHERVGGGVVP
jgi:hypothetical protein